MQKMFLSLALAVASLAAVPAKAAIVIDFEALTVANAVVNDQGFVYQESGFTLTNTSRPFPFARWGTLAAEFTGSTALFNNTIGGSTVLTRTGGGAFDLTAIDLAELNGNGVVSVTFTGTRSDSSLVSQTFTLDGIAFGAETFAFGSGFSDLVSVAWGQVSPFHQFDNIVLDGGVTGIPTPAALSVFGVGLLGLGLVLRRRLA